MIILGTKPGQHDACFALVKDGAPVFVYEQERFNRVKHGMSSHLDVLFDALNEHGVPPSDIELVTNCIDPALLPERKQQTRTYLDDTALAAVERYLDWRLPTWHRLLMHAGFPATRVVNIRHHLCHVAGVYFASPFDDAAILSVDGSGETETVMLAHGRGRDITVLRTTPHPHSLGHLYQAATIWLGWGFGEEGKTMALAGYGDPGRYAERMGEFITVDADGQFRYRPAARRGSSRYTSDDLATDVFAVMFGPRRTGSEPPEQHHADVAAAVQQVAEHIMLGSARHLRKLTGSDTLLVTGGVGLNSVANGLLSRESGFGNVVVYPHANDCGTALGGALYAYHRLGTHDTTRRWHMLHAYWGRHVDVQNVERAAAAYGATGRRRSDVAAATADLLATGKIVGWVQGRAEIGPRALGNRSILADPTARDIKNRINAGVKHRESWRPFAPSVLREDLGEYFEADEDLPYMTTVVPVRESWRERLSSICHVDGTSRVQTVTAQSNPAFHALLIAFKRRTGLGLLLNTSFNDRGEPLVQTSAQAVRLFRRSSMDALCIGDWLLTGKSEAIGAPPFTPFISNTWKLPRGRLLLVCGELASPDPVTRLDHVRPGLRLTRLSATLSAALPHDLRDRIVPDEDLDPRQLAARFDAVTCYVPRTADAFAFDATVYHSREAQIARHLMEAGPLQVYWIDVNGDVTAMRDVLYVWHDAAASPLPSYERYWRNRVESVASTP